MISLSPLPVKVGLREERGQIKAGLAAVAADGTGQLAKAEQAAVAALQKVQGAAARAVQQAGTRARLEAEATKQAVAQTLANYQSLTRWPDLWTSGSSRWCMGLRLEAPDAVCQSSPAVARRGFSPPDCTT